MTQSWYLDSHPSPSKMLGHSSLAHSCSIANSFLWGRILWRTVPPCLENVWQSLSFMSWLLGQLGWLLTSSQGKGYFLAQWLIFATKKENFMWSFFNVHYLLWSRLALLGANMSYCHKKEVSYLNILNAIFCRFLKYLKITYIKYIFCLTLKTHLMWLQVWL